MTHPVIVITGASRGIGRAVAEICLKTFNANVLAIARTESDLNALKAYAEKELNTNERVETVVGDVTEERVIDDAVDKCLKRWGRIDGLVINAGVLEPMATIADVNVGEWRQSKSALNMLIRCLAVEEPDIVAISISPGIVDTDMVTFIRTDGSKVMNEQDHKWFVDVHASNQILSPEDPSHVIAALVVGGAKKEHSGEFYNWDVEAFAGFMRKK
ncbi:6989_t:CDS:2 [Paraglomus occultum]|uniref:6989_t:CDS:1 n=1 Tax=Paraglomus occultum TaxID=144539 RepID=A0A9N9CP88_9GLOM|nr:6989_t:CDS:2 [Paraglomus occultum]